MQVPLPAEVERGKRPMSELTVFVLGGDAPRVWDLSIVV